MNFEDKSLSLIFSDSMYCSQAEIVRKKGKSLLNDPLYNKANFIRTHVSKTNLHAIDWSELTDASSVSVVLFM